MSGGISPETVDVEARGVREQSLERYREVEEVPEIFLNVGVDVDLASVVIAKEGQSEVWLAHRTRLEKHVRRDREDLAVAAASAAICLDLSVFGDRDAHSVAASALLYPEYLINIHSVKKLSHISFLSALLRTFV